MLEETLLLQESVSSFFYFLLYRYKYRDTFDILSKYNCINILFFYK